MKKIYNLLFLFLPIFSSAQIDSYSESNYDANWGLRAGGTIALSQSFYCGSTVVLDSCKFYLRKVNAPTGNAYALIYAHSGTYGTSSIPTGSTLATSAAFDVSTLTSGYGLKKFTFSGANAITLTGDTYYELVFISNVGNSTNYVRIGGDVSSPSHGGNTSTTPDQSTWTASSTSDMCFYIYGHTPSTTQKNIFMWHNF